MAEGEKEVTVKIMTEVDDKDVLDLEDRLEELNNNQVEVDVTSDSSEVDNVESSVEDLETEIENVNNTTVSPAGDSSGIESVSESVNSLNDALTAVSAGVSLAGMEQLVDTAGNINDSWNRLGLTFGEVSGQMKTDIAEAGAATGRSGGLIRSYFNDMGIAGVTNTELLQQSFEALSGRAYQTGNSIESMEQKMKMMVMSGNAGARQLTQLGISTADLGRVMGVSADEASKMFKTLSQEERLRVLTEAMGDGKKANEQYKNSWQGLKDQVNKATGALMGAVGNMILPFLIPAMQVATQAIEALSAGFKALPAPIQGVIGGVLTVVMGFLALTTVISTVRTLANTIQFLSTATQLLSGVTKIATAAQNALNLSMLANPVLLLAAALAVLIGYMAYLYSTNEQCRESVNQLGADLQRVASGDYSALRDVGNDLLAASDSFAQASGFAALIGEENYQKWVELRNGMSQTFMDILGLVGEQLMLFGQQVNIIFQQAILSIQSFGLWVYQTFMQVIMTIQQFGMQLLQLPMYIAQAVQQGVANFQAFIGQVSGILSSVISNVASFGGQLVSQLGSAASDAVSAFGSGLSGLVAEAWAEFNDVLQAIYDFGAQAVEAARGIGEQIVQAIWNRHSPGIMAQATFLETKDSKMFLEHGLSDMAVIARQGSDNIIGAYNPNLNTNVNGTGGNGGNGGVVNNFSFTFTGFINDEERLTDLIIKTITDEIEWDNTTANRTV